MDNELRTCWICYNSETDVPNLSWIKPCRCRGATQWVHQHCLQRWVDEKQRGDSSTKVNCRVCNTQYCIRYPPPGLLLHLMETVDNAIFKICPFVAGGIFITCLLWNGITYGALTIMQVMGNAEGVHLLEQSDPLALIITLPVVPVMLVLFRLVKWDEYLLNMWQKYSYRIPYLSSFFGSADIPDWRHQYNAQFPIPSFNSIPRVLTDAFFLPTCSNAFGKLLFSGVSVQWQRSLFGCLVFVLGRGFLNILYRQKKYLRNCRREILDFEEISTPAPAAASVTTPGSTTETPN